MTTQSANGDAPAALIGVDVGGTHTDVCVSAGGQLVRGKALTTHDDYSVGVVDAIGVAAGELDLTAGALLAETEALVSGTTVVTNALTELRGARVGVLITRGFKDVFRFAGGARRPLYDDQLQDNPPDVVERSSIKEIDERTMSDGSELVPLDEEQVRAAVRELRDDGVETIAICFLWSFLEPAHERRAAEIVREEWPEAFVTLSSDIFPVVREHERFFSAVFNSYCQPSVVRLLDTLAERLRGEGFAGHLSFFAGAGGAITRELAGRFPLLLLASGPAGGVTGAITLAERMGTRDVLVGDMGGTSFDTDPDPRPAADRAAASRDLEHAGRPGDARHPLDRRRRWQPRRGGQPRRAEGRPSERGLDAGTGLLRPRRHGRDGHGRGRRGRLHRPRELPRTGGSPSTARAPPGRSTASARASAGTATRASTRSSS